MEYKYCFVVFIGLLVLLLGLVVFDIYYFVRVYSLMKNYHDYEFKRNKNVLISQMLIVLIAFTSVACFGFLFIDQHELHENVVKDECPRKQEDDELIHLF